MKNKMRISIIQLIKIQRKRIASMRTSDKDIGKWVGAPG